MNGARDKLVAELVADLRPTPNPGSVAGPVVLWLAGTVVLALVLTALTGPFRAGALSQATTHPHFALESLIGVLAIVLLAANAFRAAIPGPAGPGRLLLPALALAALWLGGYVMGLWYPALEPSMAGKRAYCHLETFLFGLPPLLVGLFVIRRFWPLHGMTSGLLLGLAAGLVPALIMQFACMYVPSHIIEFHILPGLALGAVGAALGHRVLRPPS